MMDRCVLLRPGYEFPIELSGKIGYGSACGNFRNGGQETTLQNIHTFLVQQGLHVFNDEAGFSYFGGTIVGKAKDDTLGLQTIANMIKNIADIWNWKKNDKELREIGLDLGCYAAMLEVF